MKNRLLVLLLLVSILSFDALADDVPPATGGVAGSGAFFSDNSVVVDNEDEEKLPNNSPMNNDITNDNADRNTESNAVDNPDSNNRNNTDATTGSNTGTNTGTNIVSKTGSDTNSNKGSTEGNADSNPGTGTDSNVNINNNNAGNPTSPSSSSEPALSSQEESSITYSDVGANKWYATDVAKATELGLINGYDGKFYPDNNLTYSEAIKLAACMHQLKTTGKITLVNGTKNWYDTYVEYAKQNKIISKDYEWTANATRAGFVEIFAHALPDDALSAKNTVADGAIPDVKMSDYASKEIYKLYRAGILTGSDSKGTFNPDSNILRCEVAAILTRMMDESARKTINLG